MSAGDFLENSVLNYVLKSTAFTPASNRYVALFTTSASAAGLEAGTLTGEVSGGSYGRQIATFATATAGQSTNSNLITFTNMPACTVRYAAVMDASTAGNVYFVGQLPSDKTCIVGDTFTVAIGNLVITLD